MAKKGNPKRDAFIARKLAKMSLVEKIGQLLTFTRRGAMLTPSGIEQITKLQCGGLCLEPYAVETCKNLYWGNSQIDQNFQKPADYFTIANTYFAGKSFGISITPEDYTKDLNRLQKIAMARRSGIPLHMTIDFEGDFKNDYMAGGIRQFPPPMGMAAIGDPKLTYKIGLTIAKQIAAIGVTQMYSPVCDVNINPKNPEIGVGPSATIPRSAPSTSVALVKGFQDGGIAATAKHFPGRGDSATDAHDVLDVIRADKKRMHEVELVPFQAAIDAGVKAIMTGAFDLPGVRRQVPHDPVRETPDRAAAGGAGLRRRHRFRCHRHGRHPEEVAASARLRDGDQGRRDTILLKADDESRSQCFFGIKQAVESRRALREAPRRGRDAPAAHEVRPGPVRDCRQDGPAKRPRPTPGASRSSTSPGTWRKKALITMRDDKKTAAAQGRQSILVIEQRIPY